MDQPLQIISFEIKGEEWTACFSPEGLMRLWFPGQFQSIEVAPCGPEESKNFKAHANLTKTWLKAYLSGKSSDNLPKPTLDLKQGTVFQQKIWKTLQKIPFGKTKSYGEIAKSIKNPKAVRAAGGACGANPVPLIIPCHRVLAANGKLGGFSGGLAWKKRLLAMEGITV